MPHIHEKIDFVVDVFIEYKGKVLLRKHDKFNVWLAVGGHVELDEDPNQAALREVEEEVGLKVELLNFSNSTIETRDGHKELIPPVYLNIHRISETHQHCSLVYFAKASDDDIVEPENEKSHGILWLSENEIDELEDCSDEIKFYAKECLRMVE